MNCDYQKLIDEAMLGIVKKVLSQIDPDGSNSEHSYYISFLTDYPGVQISKRVKQDYPEEITILLQYQYHNLRVINDSFSVDLAFAGVSETLIVPFAALTSFVDPSVNFSLQFKKSLEEYEIEVFAELDDNAKKATPAITTKMPKPKRSSKKPSKKEGEVISFDQFRKKRR